MKKIKTWYEVTSTFDYCKITGTVESAEKPHRESDDEKGFDYFSTKEEANSFVNGFYRA